MIVLLLDPEDLTSVVELIQNGVITTKVIILFVKLMGLIRSFATTMELTCTKQNVWQ